MMPDALLSTIASFEQWRDNKAARNSSTPKPLRAQAVALLANYSKTIVLKQLEISAEQFNRWCIDYQSPDVHPHFIPLPETPQLSESLSIELKFINGNQLTFSGKLNEQVVAQLIEAAKS